jgi:hypothetical protein
MSRKRSTKHFRQSNSPEGIPVLNDNLDSALSSLAFSILDSENK